MIPGSFYDELQKIREYEKTGGLREGLKVLLTGRVPLFHGTNAARGAKILKEGLRPQGAPGISEKVTELTKALADKPLVQAERGLAFTTLRPEEARGFAAQQVGMDRFSRVQQALSRLLGRGAKIPGRAGSIARKAQSVVSEASPVHPLTQPITGLLSAIPGGKKVIRADVPRSLLHRMEGVGRELHVNPTMTMQREILREKHPLLEQLPALGFTPHVPIRGGISPEFLRGSRGYRGVSLDELKQHAGQMMQDPVGVGKDVLRSTLGLAHRPSTLLRQGQGLV